MDFYLNILSTAFNLFYPVGKHVLWRKTYERIKVFALPYWIILKSPLENPKRPIKI
jgi:hypothetical protein